MSHDYRSSSQMAGANRRESHDYADPRNPDGGSESRPLLGTSEPVRVRAAKNKDKRKGPRTYSGMYLSPKKGNDGDDSDDDILQLSRVATAHTAWNHGDISADAADQRLRLGGMGNGLFLVRQRGLEWVLSVCKDRQVFHYLIKKKNGSLSMGDEYPKFGTLDGLVNHFETNRRPGLMNSLTEPCPVPDRDLLRNQEMISSRGSAASMAPSGRKKLSKAEKKLRKRRRQEKKDRMMKEQLASLPLFTPWWSKGSCYLMGFIMVIQIWQSYKAGQFVTEISLAPKTETGTPPVGLNQDRSEVFTKVVPTNILIGPDAEDLIKYGAKYGPCMRKDTMIFAQLARQKETEASTLGCCEVLVASGVSMGQTTTEDCDVAGGTWNEGSNCDASGQNIIMLRPCCIANNGTCQITTEEYCEFFNGIWATDKQRCSDTPCLERRCGLAMVDPNTPDQWYRFIIPIFLHGGILHYAGNMMFQLSIAVQVERAAGSLRMMLIYMIAGIGGNIVSAIFSPNVPTVGCNGALFGLLGVAYVDLIQSWRIVEHPWKKLGYTIMQSAVYLLVGTIPFIDNWAHIGGFVFGIFGAIIFLPYLTFGQWDSIKKRLIMFLCIPILVVLFFVGFLIFYEIQGTEFCPQCKYLQCIPYTEDFCTNSPGWNDV